MSKRLLVTGSRDWTDVKTIHHALEDVLREWGTPNDAILLEGECPYGGADKIARDYWLYWGWPVIGFYSGMGTGRRVLGPERNQRMVDSGADLCLAFPLPNSRGTWDCVRRAEKAGIEVRVIRP